MNKITVKHDISEDFAEPLFVEKSFEIPQDSTIEEYIKLFEIILIRLSFPPEMVKERLFNEEL